MSNNTHVCTPHSAGWESPVTAVQGSRSLGILTFKNKIKTKTKTWETPGSSAQFPSSVWNPAEDLVPICMCVHV